MQQQFPISLAAFLYGVVIVLSALISVDADEFTIESIFLGGLTVGPAICLTYYFKEIIHREGDQRKELSARDHLTELMHASPTLIFPAYGVVVGIAGLLLGFSEDRLIVNIFYSGIVVVAAAAFWASYRIRRNLGTALLRTALWVAVCIMLLVLKKHS